MWCQKISGFWLKKKKKQPSGFQCFETSQKEGKHFVKSKIHTFPSIGSSTDILRFPAFKVWFFDPFFFPKSRTILAPDSDDLDLLHGGEKIGGPQNYTIWKVDGTNPPTGGIVRGYDKPRLMGVEPSTFQVVWVFPIIGVFPPKWMVKIMENPIKMDDLGVPLFSETSV